MTLWYVGAILSALGSIASNLGVNIQKFSFMKNAKLAPDQQKPYIRQPLSAARSNSAAGLKAGGSSRVQMHLARVPAAKLTPPALFGAPNCVFLLRWALGLVLVISGSLADFAALALAAQSIIAPIGSITLVSNVLFAHYGLKEPLSKRDMIGTLMIIVGSVLSVAFGNHSESSYTMDELRRLYVQTGFACYAFIVLAACLMLYASIKYLERLKFELIAKCAAYETALAAEPCDAALVEQLDRRIAELERAYEPYARVHPFAYCALSGTLSAQSILFGKMLAEMLSQSLQGNNQMTQILTYVFLACMLFSIFTQLHFLALALSMFDALYVVPVFQCWFISISTIGGAAYFQELDGMGTLQIIFFPSGLFCTLAGVYVLSARKMHSGSREVVPIGDEEIGGGDDRSARVADITGGCHARETSDPDLRAMQVCADRAAAAADRVAAITKEGEKLKTFSPLDCGDGNAVHLFVPPGEVEDTCADADAEVECEADGDFMSATEGSPKYQVSRLVAPGAVGGGGVLRSLPSTTLGAGPLFSNTRGGGGGGCTDLSRLDSVSRGRPSSAAAGDQRMARFAQRRSFLVVDPATLATQGAQTGGVAATPPPVPHAQSHFASSHAHAHAHGSHPPHGSAGAAYSVSYLPNRKRSTWTHDSNQFNHVLTVMQAGFVFFGADAPTEEEWQMQTGAITGPQQTGTHMYAQARPDRRHNSTAEAMPP